MGDSHGRGLATVATLVVLLLCPGTAHAVPTVEDFESPALTEPTAVGTQFKATTGLYFTANGPAGIYLPQIDVSALAKSPTRTLDITTDPGVEFPLPALEGRFETVVTDVTVPVRNISAGTVAHLRLDAYGEVSGTKSSGWVSIAPGAWVDLNVAAADAGNSYYKFRVLSQVSDGGIEVRVDDVSFEVDLAAAPNFAVLTEDIGGVVLPGQPKQYTIDIQRLNGFTGNVSFSGIATGFGETIGFSPNPVSGDSTTVTLTLPPDAAESTSSVLTVSGGGTPGTRTVDIPFVVESPFTVGASDPTTVQAHRCSTTEFDVSIVRNRFFDGPIDLEVVHQNATGTIPPDLGVSVTPASFAGSATTVNPATVRITRGDDADDATPVPLRLIARSGAVSRTLDFEIVRQAPRLTSVGSTLLSPPQALIAGSGISVTGNGLCPGAVLRVGNDLASSAATITPSPADDNPTRVTASAAAPRLATTGPVSVVNPSGAVASAAGLFPDVTVNGYRNRFGFSFENEDGQWEDHNEDGTIDETDEPRAVGAGSLRHWQELLGPRQTNLNACEVGALFPGCWEVITPVPTPQHLIMQTILGEASMYYRNGTCVGFSVASRRIANRQVTVDNRPAGALSAPVWSLQRTGRETIPGRGDIPLARQWQMSPIEYAAVQHAAQVTAEYVELWIRRRTSNAIAGPGAMRAAIERDLRAGRHPLLNINWEGGGHAVNVYDVEDRPGGGFFLRIYDNNYPFRAAELAADGRDHHFRDETVGRIEVTPGGAWTMPGLETIVEPATDTTPAVRAPRTGPTGDLSWVTVENELPVFPSSLASVDGWRVLATPTAGSTSRALARAAASGDKGLLELGYLDGTGSMLTAESGRAHAIPVSPGKNGTTEVGVFGEGAVAHVEAGGASARDRVLLPKGGADAIGFRAEGASARSDLTLISDRAGRLVRLRGVRRGTTSLRLDNGAVQIAHRGAGGPVELELAGFGDRQRGSRLTTKLRLGARSTVRLTPRWDRLGRRLAATVDGHRVTLRNRVRPPVRVMRVGLKVTRKKARARATVRARMRGNTRALKALVVHVQVLRGTTVVGRATRQLATGRRATARLARGVPVKVKLDAKKLKGAGALRARAIVTASAGSAIPVASSRGGRGPVR